MELFTKYEHLRPDEWAVLIGFYPVGSAWSYLRRQYLHGYLGRGRDRSGRIVYRLRKNGARYLLWYKTQFPDAKVIV